MSKAYHVKNFDSLLAILFSSLKKKNNQQQYCGCHAFFPAFFFCFFMPSHWAGMMMVAVVIVHVGNENARPQTKWICFYSVIFISPLNFISDDFLFFFIFILCVTLFGFYHRIVSYRAISNGWLLQQQQQKCFSVRAMSCAHSSKKEK